MNKPCITDIPLKQLSGIMTSLEMKPYVTSQIVSWLYKKRVDSFNEMTNLSNAARELLNKEFSICKLSINNIAESKDGTKKFVFNLKDGNKIESVLISAEKGRNTVCLSTQVGCAFSCSFCRTGLMGFIRDLSQGEILGQIREIQKLLEPEKKTITNIVFMGMGEPFANYQSLCNSIDIMLDEKGFNFSKRKITVSSCGLIPQLVEFSKSYEIKIAISLNATENKTRDLLMPVNKRYPLEKIFEFCRDYSKSSKNRITFEYILIKDVNDTDQDMQRFVKLLHKIRAKVNLIPYNSFKNSKFQEPSKECVDKWFRYLSKKGIQTNVRVSKGQDVLAACGQLAS